ncbi:Maturation and nuclear export of 40S ribosomal subunits interacting protein [Coniosporium apollinis]|uniref:Maturation and nuclear export of 40S ribosomal subunits interacting protein n=1 Tax=Coniosporium apollinis TaxID=61459 RepID=A0ABQ9P433_9PEZI|nr:Maturation and nuclear export of 40S ribosomal subunits interacting protein [Coniosporium apollinis]
MPFLTAAATAGKKRKRDVEDRHASQRARNRSKPKSTATEEEDTQAQILLLENQILESRRHYNNIATLLSTAKQQDGDNEVAQTALIALCRVFSRLMAGGSMVKSKTTPESEVVIIQWLKERYQEYTQLLLDSLRGVDVVEQGTVLTLLMRLVKEESVHLHSQGDYAWKNGLFIKVVGALLEQPSSTDLISGFLEEYVEEYDDIRFYMFQVIPSLLGVDRAAQAQERATANALALLSGIESIPESKDDLKNYFGEAPDREKHPLKSLQSHKRQAQDAWLALLRSGLGKEQRKAVLGIMTHRVVPWFIKVELLMDFLTDSYNVGGATSLLALSGLFHLIQEKNLDYPSFYQKLYSLLDSGILHSKHRSRFFRLLDTFMSSTHLPAALVASFIKRLSRLALQAPPAGIVVVVPWVYNMLMKHPSCTFMIHREIRVPESRKQLEEEGMDDPFDMDEVDPMQTGAIESSLWEIETLQSHYHPNVGTLAKIISEQFTKRSYNLEDFLDHSYNGLIEAELARELKKAPVVEYEIPKRIFTDEGEGLGHLGGLMAKLLEVS